ncbi:hypothetical protein [Cellulomonas sp. URHD0024]|uniref:hypothetical protein n=1 Tax=Cellulomonas sp. URHD0024 TaxID=1302620 RepID=UPI0012DBE1F4|nr:hypothetical protein [Cellulomonas sp. URHD0024]
MTESEATRDDGLVHDVEELAHAGGVGISAGEPSSFEPEEDPESVDDADTES